MYLLNHMLSYGDQVRVAYALEPISPPGVGCGNGDTKRLVDKKDTRVFSRRLKGRGRRKRS
jgi:hypothetical protein